MFRAKTEKVIKETFLKYVVKYYLLKSFGIFYHTVDKKVARDKFFNDDYFLFDNDILFCCIGWEDQ